MTIYLTCFDRTSNPVTTAVDPGIEAPDMDATIDFNYIKEQFHIEIPVPDIHLFHLHRRLWKDFIDSPAEHCLIMQEDVRITESFSVIADFFERLPAGWEVYFPTKEKNKKKAINALYSLENNTDIALIMDLYLNGSIYLVTRSGAQKLLNISLIPESMQRDLFHPSTRESIAVSSGIAPWLDPSPATLSLKNDKIRKAIFNFNSWSPSDKESVKQLLKIVSEQAHKLNIQLILHGGSLLGFIRHGGIIPWDDDIDIGIAGEQANRFFQQIGLLADLRIDSFIEDRTGTVFYKIWSNIGSPIENYDYRFPFIDVWLYETDGKNILFHNGILFRNAAAKPFTEASFEGALYSIPHNPQECLDGMYHDWRRAIRIYPWSHRLEAIAKFPLQTEISTDIHGKLKT